MITFVPMNSECRYSIIVPVYNRPQEIAELLESLARQDYTNFEVLIVEDGSTDNCVNVYESFEKRLSIRYFFKQNTGPGPSRNFGFQQARGDYLVVFDSDCILPSHYFSSVEKFLSKTPVDAWGGPDRGHKDFTDAQRAMAFTMSSFFTTGGIRGDRHNNSFQPRSFNMGISKEVFEKTGGFQFDRYAEDIEFSIRIKKSGFKTILIPDAFVYHKRRANFKQFYRQVFNFGRGRVMVGRVHKGAVKLTHWFPLFFLFGLVVAGLLFIVNIKLGAALGLLYITYWISLSISAYKSTHSLGVTLLSGPSALVQLVGYGAGFLKEKLNTLHSG